MSTKRVFLLALPITTQAYLTGPQKTNRILSHWEFEFMESELEGHEDLKLRLLFWNRHAEAMGKQRTEKKKSKAKGQKL